MKMKITNTLVFMATLCLWSCAQQEADDSYDVTIKNPFFVNVHPRVLIDEAHKNIHTATGTYKPFADLMENDGCVISRNKKAFDETLLNEQDVLVISNAKGREEKTDPAFTDDECTAVENWVKRGGSLLLIADHYPMGGAAQNLSNRFGVNMSNGETSDSIHFQGNAKFRDELVFSRENGLLQEHPITQGKTESEKINTVFTFRGQCLSVPDNGMILLKLSPHAVQSLVKGTRKEGGKTYIDFEDASAAGYCQGLALHYGKGRVVILGEAAMLTAQKYEDEKFGMNTPGNDNRQFALNIMHWLGGGLE